MRDKMREVVGSNLIGGPALVKFDIKKEINLTDEMKATAIVPQGMIGPVAAPKDILDISADETIRKLAAISQFQSIVRERLHEGFDYGIIPGTGNKPTLLKPGAEKIAKLLNCYDHYEFIAQTEDFDRPFFHYLVRCTLIEFSTGTKISSGIGECNSMESKYRWRWVREEDLPANTDKAQIKKKGSKRTLFEFNFALDKAETTGTYGKPKEHWQKFSDAINAGTARQAKRKTKSGKEFDGIEIDEDLTLYRVPNEEIYDQVNTLVKMAKKRALVDAALSAGRLSDLFTQDLEDLRSEAREAAAFQAVNEREDHPSDGGGWGDGKTDAEPDAPKPDEENPVDPEIEELFTMLVTRFRYRPEDIYKRLSEKFGVTSITRIPDDRVEAVAAYLNETVKVAEAKAAKR